MAEIILTNVLNKTVSVDELFKWLTADNLEDTICTDVVQNESTRTEFLSYFLNCLRESSKSLLADSKEVQEKVAKKAIDESHKTDWTDGRKVAIERSNSSADNVCPSPRPDESRSFRNDDRCRLQIQPVVNPRTWPPPNFGPNNFVGGQHRAVASTPNPSPNVSYDGYNVSIDQAQMQMGMINLSASSGIFDNSSRNVFAGPNTPQTFNNSMINGSGISNAPYSPVSPLYANHVSTFHPRSVEKSINETTRSQDCSAVSANSSRTSTPKGTPASAQKMVKSGQNQNLSLRDFIKVEAVGQGSKKNAKKQSRTQQCQKSQENTNSQADNGKSNANGGNPKRRINPTRLDVSYDKEGPVQEVFGIINRPNAANPKFVEAPSTDKSQELASYEIERELLKQERRKQPKIEFVAETMNAEQKLSVKFEAKSTTVPCVDLVNNVEMLDTLANIYSGILHRNLMTNPMTELYFLITLLTGHYKNFGNKESTEIRINDDRAVSSLDDDLGCAEINDAITGESDCEDASNNHADSRKKTIDSSIDVSTNSTEIIETKGFCLDTPHNCVYFATLVMTNQQLLLSTLDRATLKLLCDNHQINAFKPELKNQLNEIYRFKCSRATSIKPMDSKNLQTNVCFQVDDDNRETFPSSKAFTLFRKQRDSFYDILREWEDNHLKPDWSFERALKNKIDFLLDLHTDAVNHCHFAKLFVSQLLVSSMQGGQPEDPMDDESLSFLMSLKNVKPEKLLQLKGRLVTPLVSTGPVPQPIFPGVQEFYKNFILTVRDWKFHAILQTNFIHEIVELNDAQFAGIEIDETDTIVNESTRQNYITCLTTLRLLAKFASFTVSMPFATSSSPPEWIQSQMKLRRRVLPSLDLRGCLTDAIFNGRLSLTIPWIVQYLSMLDTITLRLPYYVDVCQRLYRIYRISNRHEPNDSMSSQTSVLVMFTIGWLFELPNFPRDVHSFGQTFYEDEKFHIVRRDKDDGARDHRNAIKSIDVESAKKFSKRHSSLDKLDVIDDRALHECCPFLTELKILLISGNSATGNANPNRHITPVSCQLPQQNSTVKTKNLQIQLEEAFFHGQPSSMRKTVDFVSERVASSCVKYICNTIIPIAKQRKMNDFVKSNDRIVAAIKDDEKLRKSPDEESTTNEDQARWESLNREIAPLATIIVETARNECDVKLSKMCEQRTLKSFESLLSDDVVDSVRQTCAAIAKRTAMQRVNEWIDLHITASLFMKTLLFELRKLLKYGDADRAGKKNFDNPDAPCPTKIIDMMRNSMWELLENEGRWPKVTVESVTTTLTYLRQTLTERTDLVGHLEKNIYVMSVEFCLLILAKRPNLFTPDVQHRFVNVWMMNRMSEAEGLFVRIISPRNIRLLTDTTEKFVFKTFGRLLRGLLKEELLSIESLSDQCVALFRQEWPETTLKQLSQCLNEVVADYKSSSVHAESVKNLLVWIASTCDEMDVFDYD